MLALLTTYLIVAYILIPGVLFRLPASLFIRLRLFQLTKTQEATFGCFVSLLPFLLALFFVWHVPIARNRPFSLPNRDLQEYKDDYRRALTLVVAEDPSKLLQSTPGQPSKYALSMNNLEHRQFRFLTWYYVFITCEGVLFGYMARKYGDWSDIRIYEWVARKFLLSNVSEWQLLLTDFTFPKKPKRDVFADVLCDDHLYRGRVGDYFLDTSGGLSGIFMKNVERFRSKEFEEARRGPDRVQADKEQFWSEIPGANFYIPADKITNLNVRFPYERASDLQEFLGDVLKRAGIEGNVSVEIEEPGDSSEAIERTSSSAVTRPESDPDPINPVTG